jgi:predicted AlkP superfamily phosphohydrolase/phosphomutase
VSVRAARAGLAAAFVLIAGCTKPPPPTRVLVVGLDGATWDVARPMLDRGELPHLRSLIAHGIVATPTADQPNEQLIAPVVWTTLFTGVPPAQHGVANWALAGSGYRRVPALWSRLDGAGKSSVIVNVPGTWKAERLEHGVVVADVGMARGYVGGAGGGTYVDLGAGPPQRPYDRLQNLIQTVAGPLEVGEWSDWVDVTDDALEKSVLKVKRLDARHVYVSPMYQRDLGADALWPREVADDLADFLGVPYIREGPSWSGFGAGEVPAIFAEHLAQTTAVQLAAAHHLMSTRPWDLFVWVDPLVDRIEHAYFADHRERVEQAYRDADAHLGDFIARAPRPPAASWIVVVSAHGFGPGEPGRRGEHASAGMLVISGPDLEGDAGNVPLVDVAPTLACLLGVSADGMSGTTIAAIRRMRSSCR